MSNYNISAHSPSQVRKGWAARKPSRRQVLIGGLAVGAGLVGGVLVEHRLSTSSQPQSTTGNPLLLDTSWDGLDFAWLPDNAHIAYTSAHGLCLLDVKSGQKSWPNHSYNYPATVGWSANGTRLAFTVRGKLLVQDTSSGQNLWTYQDPQQPIQAAALSPDGTRVALTTIVSTASAQVWSIQKGSKIARYAGQGSAAITTLTWSPDSTRIATATRDGSAQVWEASNGHLLWSYQGTSSSGPRGVISWSPDGSVLAFAASNQNQLGIWDAQTGQVRLQTTADVGDPNDQKHLSKSIAWSPDGSRIAFWTTNQATPLITVCSTHTAQQLFTCQAAPGQLNAISWSPNGAYLAAANYIVGSGELAQGDNGSRSLLQFWDARNGNALASYKAPKSPDHLAWSPDSRALALLTPKAYGIRADSTCLSLCSYGYKDYALQVFQSP